MSATQKKLIGVAALLGVVAAYWFLILAPKQEEAAALADEVATKQASVDAAQATLANYEKSRAAYKGNYATVVRLGKAVPGDDDVRSLMVQLSTASNRSGVDFETVSIGGAAAGADSSTASTAKGGETPPPGAQSVGSAGFWVMPLQFSFGGQFDHLSTFFARLERFVTVSEQRVDVTGRLLRIDSLHVAPESDGSRYLRAEVGASSYLVPPSESVTGGATSAAPAAVQASTPGSGSGTTPPTTSATTTGVSSR